MADCFTMLHFHIGSQVADIRYLKAAVNELAHIYTELKRMGAGLSMMGIGFESLESVLRPRPRPT